MSPAEAKALLDFRLGHGEVERLGDDARRLAEARRPGGVLHAPPALRSGSFVVDTNYLRYVHYAQTKLNAGTPLASLPVVERNVYQHYQPRWPSTSE